MSPEQLAQFLKLANSGQLQSLLNGQAAQNAVMESHSSAASYATGTSEIDGGMREGIVFRTHDGVKSFKAVSNEFLLKYHG